MKRVLWISRHQMTQDQKYDLEQVLGDQVVLVMWTETVESMATLLPLVEQADAVAAVLPTNLLAQMWKHCRGKRPVPGATGRRWRDRSRPGRPRHWDGKSRRTCSRTLPYRRAPKSRGQSPGG